MKKKNITKSSAGCNDSCTPNELVQNLANWYSFFRYVVKNRRELTNKKKDLAYISYILFIII